MGFVRCKGPDGAEFVIDETAAEAFGVTVVGPADVDGYGNPTPPKPRTDLAGKPAAAKTKES